MATMWSFVDERKVLGILLDNKKTININTYQKIIVYIKHLKELGKSKNEIRNELDNIMEQHYNGFVSTEWFNTLNSLVNKYTKPSYREFRKLEDIHITQEELKFIKSHQDVEIEKILFVMLVIAKSACKDKNNLWVNCESQEVFKLAKFKYKKGVDRMKQRGYAIHDMCKRGLLEVSKICDSIGIKIMFGQSNIYPDDMVLRIDEDNIEHMVMYYLQWRDGLPNCNICGIPFIKKSNRSKHCKKCADDLHRKQSKEWARKNRINCNEV